MSWAGWLQRCHADAYGKNPHLNLIPCVRGQAVVVNGSLLFRAHDEWGLPWGMILEWCYRNRLVPDLPVLCLELAGLGWSNEKIRARLEHPVRAYYGEAFCRAFLDLVTSTSGR